MSAMLKRSVGANTLRKLGDSATHRRAARRSLLDGGVPEAKSEFCKQRVGGYQGQRTTGRPCRPAQHVEAHGTVDHGLPRFRQTCATGGQPARRPAAAGSTANASRVWAVTMLAMSALIDRHLSCRFCDAQLPLVIGVKQ